MKNIYLVLLSVFFINSLEAQNINLEKKGLIAKEMKSFSAKMEADVMELIKDQL